MNACVYLFSVVHRRNHQQRRKALPETVRVKGRAERLIRVLAEHRGEIPHGIVELRQDELVLDGRHPRRHRVELERDRRPSGFPRHLLRLPLERPEREHGKSDGLVHHVAGPEELAVLRVRLLARARADGRDAIDLLVNERRVERRAVEIPVPREPGHVVERVIAAGNERVRGDEVALDRHVECQRLSGLRRLRQQHREAAFPVLLNHRGSRGRSSSPT